ncbi:hypothetical protein TREAZ_1518 [Leadbettera azotonutricia ZAS-9]|uniref:Uncharacterized protein n=1 Tax=Leadbettera azotonutricia (strain ATCC BAA-888 / DSM 13862 / ZAS-9) TaxID=545695 RepID=F5YE35_LEAAZ|nr:hypothetical protein TREAZ_1518 [Leadbettera azotonutricia ZAS-9]
MPYLPSNALPLLALLWKAFCQIFMQKSIDPYPLYSVYFKMLRYRRG